jgi:predicted lipid-binding transport protein (Tim44 family)
MKRFITALILAFSFAALVPAPAEAKRFGGGGSSGMQRSLPARTPPPAAPAQPTQAAPTPPAAVPGTPAVAPKRSWMGPLAGLAAGLGIAALMSHFGMGAEFGNIIMLVLLALVGFVALRFVMSRFGHNTGSSPAMATPGGMQFTGGTPKPVPASAPWSAPAAAAIAAPVTTTPALPAGFDAAGFERIAKMIFIRMQAANDKADLTDLRNFTTPEMFAAIKLDLQDRANSAQTTDVVRIDAEVLEVASEAERQLVSVRFHGLIREENDGVAAPFDEVWHLVKPSDGSREWAIAGIQQSAVA